MRAITSSWEDTLHVPTKLAGLVSPDGSNSVGSSLWISRTLLCVDFEEQKLVSTTIRSNVATVQGPINGGDERTMTCELLALLIIILLGVKEVNDIIVRSNSKELVAWRVNHGFYPLSLFGVLEQVFFVDIVKRSLLSGINLGPVDLSDGDDTHVSSNSQVLKLIAVSNASGLTVWWLRGHGRSSALLFLTLSLDDTLSKSLVALNIIGKNSVVIT